MRILLLTPGINKNYNDNYYAYAAIVRNGHSILAISTRIERLKTGGSEYAPALEQEGYLSIHRLFRDSTTQQSWIHVLLKAFKIMRIVRSFQPDIVFAENAFAGHIIWTLLLKFMQIPIVTRLEFIYDPENPLGFARGKRVLDKLIFGDRIFRQLSHSNWKRLCRNSSYLISCYWGDNDKAVPGVPLQYIPWPSEVPSGVREACSREKKANRIVFIGALDKHKNIESFMSTIPALLGHTPIEEFWIVGMGPHLPVIHALQELCPGRVRHIPVLSRVECLELISESLFGYSPASWGSWGFIGDCWAMGTPLVVTTNHYCFHDAVDAIVTTKEKIVVRVNEAISNEAFYSHIQTQGRLRYVEKHCAGSVGAQYLKVCETVLDKNHGNVCRVNSSSNYRPL
jgi:glycosyltransferase involved in cell wall biosynthesis